MRSALVFVPLVLLLTPPVTYTGCTVVSGPLSLGLSALPPTVNGSRLTRHCTRFAAAACTYATLPGGAKLVCRDGGPVACP